MCYDIWIELLKLYTWTRMLSLVLSDWILLDIVMDEGDNAVHGTYYLVKT